MANEGLVEFTHRKTDHSLEPAERRALSMGTVRSAEISGSTRRVLLTTLATAPVMVLFAHLAGALRRQARLVRPTAEGSSTTRCAQCGDPEHGMLACPFNPKLI